MRLTLRDLVGLVIVIAAVSAGLQSTSEAQQLSAKRGLAAFDSSLINATNSSWGYDYSTSLAGLNGEFVPMFFSGNTIENSANTIIQQGDAQYVLGFNEPERSDQANISVAVALERWRRLSDSFAGSDILLVSPAVSDNQAGRNWLDEFMVAVDADDNLRVDEIAFHWYGTVNINNPASGANTFLNAVERYHNLYNRNVWITEFAGLDFGNNFTTEEINDWNQAFLDIVIPELEARDYVTRYAWWNHNNDSRLVEQAAFNRYRATLVGDTYVGTLSDGDTRDMNGAGLGLTFQYLRGGLLRNTGEDTGQAFGRLYAMTNHDGSVANNRFGGSGDWSMFSFGSFTIEENAILRKVGLNTVTLRNLDVEIDGTLTLNGGAINQGILEISGGGTIARGDGLIQLLFDGSHLVLGRPGDTGSLELPFDFETRQNSIITINNSNVVLTGDMNVLGRPIFEMNEDMEYGGVISSANVAGIVKEGEATLALTGQNTYTGSTEIRAGALLVNETHVGGNGYFIQGGTLGGSGVIDSGVNLNSGSVAPGADTSMGTQLTITGDLNQAAGTALSFNIYSNSNDSLDIGGTVNLAGELVVELSPDYVPQDGDAFTLVQSGVLVGDFSSVTVLGTPDDFDAGVQIENGNVVLTLTDAVSVLLGDVNQDGAINFLDITTFIGLLSGGPYRAEADIDQNGTVNFLDISPFIALLSGQ